MSIGPRERPGNERRKTRLSMRPEITLGGLASITWPHLRVLPKREIGMSLRSDHDCGREKRQGENATSPYRDLRHWKQNMGGVRIWSKQKMLSAERRDKASCLDSAAADHGRGTLAAE
ncbi:hypothetical protein H109_00578 [Trichophyton interdigitale MR816]|uniref:Uncharacterized protein n=1 Tax=Trichophyton interdigitale (strain MR816) TaxID=1215338 RepID=A0A059JJK9_TRIIM|nr:hypothetical protein H109_00578 [Trichophyton interdigitale MR816]